MKANGKKSRKVVRLLNQPEEPQAWGVHKPEANRAEDQNVSIPVHQVTEIAARVDVGFGNQLFIRGESGGLSWEKGMPLQCKDASTWVWSTREARDKVVFKLLLNDQVWSRGTDLVVEAGQRIETIPQFHP